MMPLSPQQFPRSGYRLLQDYAGIVLNTLVLNGLPHLCSPSQPWRHPCSTEITQISEEPQDVFERGPGGLKRNLSAKRRTAAVIDDHCATREERDRMPSRGEGIHDNMCFWLKIERDHHIRRNNDQHQSD